MVAAIDASNVILLPEMVYFPTYWLQPAEPLTLPSEVNWAEMPVPATSGWPFKAVSAHTLPVRSPPPPLWDTEEPQAARTSSPAHNPIENNICFMFKPL